MENYILSCSSTCDLTEELLKERNISYLLFHYYLNDQHYFDDFGKTISFPDFYQLMREGADTKTSQVNVEEYKEYFEKLIKEGKDIVHLELSSGLSGASNSARIAAEELMEENPDKKIYIIDSLGASSGFGLLLTKLADLRDAGYDAEKLYVWAEKNKKNMHHWFFSTDLTFFIKGGRVSPVSGWFGTLLKICPLLNMNHEGKLIPRHKIRGKAKVIEEIVAKMENHAQKGTAYSEECYICHSDCIEDALAVKKLVEEKFKNLKGEVKIFDIGTTIGSHTGPGTVALFFWGDERVD